MQAPLLFLECAEGVCTCLGFVLAWELITDQKIAFFGIGFANELLTANDVQLFAETIYRLHKAGFLVVQPQEYRVHEISIVKQYLFIQHEALVVEICHAPNPEPAEPTFFILIDCTTFCSSMSSGAPQMTWSARIWGLRPAASHQNLGMNIVQLAIALRSAVEYAPHYNTLKQNCFWLMYASTTLIQRHILPPNTFIIDNNEKCLFCIAMKQIRSNMKHTTIWVLSPGDKGEMS
jgi:hypothetical protein